MHLPKVRIPYLSRPDLCFVSKLGMACFTSARINCAGDDDGGVHVIHRLKNLVLIFCRILGYRYLRYLTRQTSI